MFKRQSLLKTESWRLCFFFPLRLALHICSPAINLIRLLLSSASSQPSTLLVRHISTSRCTNASCALNYDSHQISWHKRILPNTHTCHQYLWVKKRSVFNASDLGTVTLHGIFIYLFVFFKCIFTLNSLWGRCSGDDWWRGTGAAVSRQNEDALLCDGGEVCSAPTSPPSHFKKGGSVLFFLVSLYHPAAVGTYTLLSSTSLSPAPGSPPILPPGSPEIIRVLQMKSQGHKSGSRALPLLHRSSRTPPPSPLPSVGPSCHHLTWADNGSATPSR